LTFVLAGQSNMAGSGPIGEQSAPRNNHVTVWSPHGWITAIDPLGYGDPGTEPAVPFADAIYRATGRNVRLVQCAVGATALSVWLPHGSMYESCRQRVRAAGVTTVSGVLFFQGEEDAVSADLASTWAARFGGFVAGVRADFHRKLLPIVFAQIGHAAGDQFPAWNTVKAQQASYSAPVVAMIRTDDQPQQPENVHFTTAAYQVIGARFAAAWLSLR
jgi:hypothetical protein